MFSISDFRSSIDSQGVLKSNKFIATIGVPRILQSSFSDIGSLLSIRCENVHIPGVNLVSADGPPVLGYGPQIKHPYGTTFDDITLTFILDADSKIHKFFYTWISAIVNFRGQGGYAVSFASDESNRPYEAGYKDDYSTSLVVQSFKDVGDVSHTVTAYQAFPMGLPSLTASWSDTDLVKLTVPFTYTDFDVSY